MPLPLPLIVAGAQFGASLLQSRSQNPTKAELVAHYIEVERMKRNADAAEAAGTREAGERRKAGDELLSDSRAVMASQGGSASDAGAVERAGDIGENTDYNVLAALYESQTQADNMRVDAEIKSAAKPRGPSTLNTVLSAASSAYSGYTSAGGKFKTGDATPPIKAKKAVKGK